MDHLIQKFGVAFEPYAIKTVSPIRISSREERVQKLKAAGYNTMSLDTDDVIIDLVSDSGTAAMSNQQWSALMLGDYLLCLSVL